MRTELEILRHQLPLVPLEGRDHAADEEIGLRQALHLAAAAGNPQTIVHAPQQGDQAHRIQVEHRLGRAAEAGGGIVAGDGQDVVEPFRGVAPGRRFQPVAVLVLAGQVQHDLPAAVGHLPGQPVGRQHRATARIVGHRNPADARVVQKRTGEGDQVGHGRRHSRAAGSDHFCAVVEAVAREHFPIGHTVFCSNHGITGLQALASFRANATAVLALSL